MNDPDPVETPAGLAERATAWLTEVLGAHPVAGDVADYGADPDATRAAKEFQAALYDAGFAGLGYPAKVGGRGLGTAHEQAFADAAADHALPGRRLFLVGIGMCAPTILALGNEEQKRRFLPPLLRGEEVWCQLFSEPGAGSDLAGLRSRVRRDGDDWVLDGQKVWTTHALACDYALVVARSDTSVPKHAGLTMFVLDMRSAGITVRPIRQLTGESDFNEVFFDGVRIPDSARLGAVGGGWDAVRVMLSNERTSIGDRTARLSQVDHEYLLRLAARTGVTDPGVRRRVADVLVRERAVALLAGTLQANRRAGLDPGPYGSVVKLAKARLGQHAAEVGFDLLGAGAVGWDPGGAGDPADAEDAAGTAAVVADALSRTRSQSIAGGTDDIQRNIIGERLLGLPREIPADRGIPFDQLSTS